MKSSSFYVKLVLIYLVNFDEIDKKDSRFMKILRLGFVGLCFLLIPFQQLFAQSNDALWQSPEQYQARCDEAINQTKLLVEDLKKLHDYKKLSLLNAYQQTFLQVDALEGWSSLLFNVHEDEKIRNVAQACEQKISKFKSDFFLDPDIFKVFQRIKDLETSPHDADQQAQRVYDLLIREFKRNGVQQSQEVRKRLSVINEEITQLSQDYLKNINQDRREITLNVKDLQGLTEDFIKPRTDAQTKKVKISTDYTDYFPVMQYASKREVRKQLYQLFMQRGYPQNKPVLEKLLKLRHEYAKTLGYDNWAQYHAEDKMAQKDQTIEQFINHLNDITKSVAQKEKQLLLTYLQKDEAQANTLEVWDRLYYTNLVQKDLFKFDPQQVRDYFEYNAVKNGIFDLYAELFGLEFVSVQNPVVWHPQVEQYEVKVGGKLLGKFYLDMHPRANKYKHAAMFPLQTGIKGGQIPIATLVCNFPEPKKGVKMEHKEVVTFFHEFGHLIHQLLAQQSTWLRLSGISVEWDFVEAPSQILEEWAFDETVLNRFARNSKNEQMPKELLQQLKASSEFAKALGISVQLFYAAYSFYLHHEEPTFDLLAKNKELYEKYAPFPFDDQSFFFANFGHLVGYSSGYYTYQWSLVIAKDLFTRFQKEGLMNLSTAREYAEKILAPGSMKSAGDLVKDFLGRPYQLDAYQKWLTNGQAQTQEENLKPNVPKTNAPVEQQAPIVPMPK